MPKTNIFPAGSEHFLGSMCDDGDVTGFLVGISSATTLTDCNTNTSCTNNTQNQTHESNSGGNSANDSCCTKY